MKLVLAVLTVGLVLAISASVASAYNPYNPYGGSGYTPPTYSYPSYVYTPSYGLGSYYGPSYYTGSSYYGQLNRAGYPKNQYVRPYYRSNGTYVQGYWRNSPNDAYPTCRVIRC